jgi:hypothetical protein
MSRSSNGGEMPGRLQKNSEKHMIVITAAERAISENARIRAEQGCALGFWTGEDDCPYRTLIIHEGTDGGGPRGEAAW